MTDTERVELLRKELAPTIAWYRQVLEAGEPDGSYLYDMTVDQFGHYHHGIYQTIIEALLPDDVVRAPVKADDDD